MIYKLKKFPCDGEFLEYLNFQKFIKSPGLKGENDIKSFPRNKLNQFFMQSNPVIILNNTFKNKIEIFSYTIKPWEMIKYTLSGGLKDR